MHGTVKTLSDLLHLHCGTASQIISGLKIASLNSRVFCSPGMGPNVAVLHVDLHKAASTKAESTTAESVIRPKQLIRKFSSQTKKKKKLKLSKPEAKFESSTCRTATNN
jgi:hypothetical protein